MRHDKETNPDNRGRIVLVGAGPGDPDLITIAGAKSLAKADVVLYDRLINPALLELAPQAKHIYIGKEVGQPHHEIQKQIHEQMLEHAAAGKCVVRLKGGDPFIFGRGGEEAEEARRAGFDCDIIPGVTSALGATAATSIPLTHRDHSSSVTFITGCCAGDIDMHQTDWAAISKGSDTLVIYMGARNLAAIARRTIDAGRSPGQPVAVIMNATEANEKIEFMNLGSLADGEKKDIIRAPAIVIIGEVVRLGVNLRELAAAAHHPGP
jgi:uroporphyrin-III C-methyltransferase